MYVALVSSACGRERGHRERVPARRSHSAHNESLAHTWRVHQSYLHMTYTCDGEVDSTK